MWWSTEASEAPRTESALAEVLAALEGALPPGAPHLALVFFSHHHQAEAASVGLALRARWPALRVIGASGGGLVAGARELERGPALSITLGQLPDVAITAFHLFPDELQRGRESPALLRRRLALPANQRPAFLLLPDRRRDDAEALCEAFDGAYPDCPKAGGGAGTGADPALLLLDDRVYTEGIVGVALCGNLEMEVLVSPGATPIGRRLTATAVDHKVIQELDDKPAVVMLDSVSASLPAAERDRFRAAPLVGVALDPDRSPLRAGDFQVVDLLAVNRGTGAIAVNSLIEEGALIQLHIRQPDAARAELEGLLLRARRDEEPPTLALLFACMARGAWFFGQPNQDAGALHRHLGPLPIAGLLCDGELGPAHGATRLHRYAAVVALIRPRRWD